jgi:hypothetical protein
MPAYANLKILGLDENDSHNLNQQIQAEDSWTRQQAALNPNLSQDISERLAHDEDEMVRRSVATNPACPFSTLKILMEDRDPRVRQLAARNPSTPLLSLEELSQSQDDEWIRSGVAGNSATPAEVLKRLAKDENAGVRAAVAANKEAPPEIVALLAQDPDEDVSDAALENPAMPREALDEIEKRRADEIDSNVLIKKITELFSVLRAEGIFAIDIDGGGWAPNDHGLEIVYEELLDGGWQRKNTGACWTDTKWYVDEIGPDFSNANIYYSTLIDNSGPESIDENNALEIAKIIVEKANEVGLKVSWSGDTSAAISVRIE